MSIRKITVAAIVALSVACSAGPTANVTTDASEGTLTVTETPACTAEQKAECAAKCEAAKACDGEKKEACTGSSEDESSDA